MILGKSQGVVSRYEKGTVEPPGEVILHCMHILGDTSIAGAFDSGVWDEALRALETAATLVRALRDKSANITLRDPTDDNAKRPRSA